MARHWSGLLGFWMFGTAKQRVLVVDDEPQVLVALEDLLGSDYVVFKSESGENALRLLEEEPDISVVVSDQRMPKMGGDELLSRLSGVTDATRVLVTGYADIAAVVRAVNEGRLFAYVSKPWEPSNLRLTVDKAAKHFQLQRDLAREKAMLKRLMDSSPDGIFFKDSRLRFQRVNASFKQTLDDAARGRDLLGKALSDVSEDPSIADIEQEERRILTDGAASEDVVHSVRRGTGRHFFSTSRAPVLGPRGNVTGVVGIVRDVTERLAIAEALHDSEERLQLVVSAAAAGVFDWDVRSGTVHYSEELEELLAVPKGSLRSQFTDFQSRFHPDDAEAASRAIVDHLERKTPLRMFDCRLELGNGGYGWFRLNAQGVWNTEGRAVRMVGAIHDIGERKRQEERLARLSRIRAMLGGINGALLRLRDREGLLQRCCEIAVQDGELAGALVVLDGPLGKVQLANAFSSALAFDETVLADDITKVCLAQWSALSAGPQVLNDLTTHDAGAGAAAKAAGLQSAAIVPLIVESQFAGALVFVSTLHNVFDAGELLVLMELASNVAFALGHLAQGQRLSFLMSSDELTGLSRRELFVDRLQQRFAACHAETPYLAVLWFDISRFRQVNESLGREGGDELLREISRRLAQGVGDRNSVARLDGNAFGVMTPALKTETDAVEFLERAVWACLVEPIWVGEVPLRVVGTAGIALYPGDGDRAEALLSSAETACKMAKSGGQPYLFYTPTMNQRVSERLSMETKLRGAIENEEFILHYQPKVDLKSGAVVGLEALIRWNDPLKGLVPPFAFIPILEETGLILQVGNWVLREAARQYAEWKHEGRQPPRIAVNVSAIQMAHPDFVRSVSAVIDEFPEADGGLDLEITESVVMTDLSAKSKKLAAVRELGFEVAIDDFGTGYSSLGYISRLPVDALKIDRSFIVRMGRDAQDMSIVMTMIGLAHALDLKVIAEGVERTNQAQLLKLLKCDQIQGYLISKPMPAKEVVSLLGVNHEFLSPASIG